MDTTTATPAGAATSDVITETVSATKVAAEKGDVSTFLDADRAARSGKPIEKVTRPAGTADAAKASGPIAGKGGEAAKGPSAADRDADARLQTRIREAVDLSTSELRRQNKELLDRINVGKPAAGAGDDKTGAPAGERPKAGEDYERFLAMPNAPKEEDFKTPALYAAALSSFITETRQTERADADRTVATALERETKSIERVQSFHGRINDYKQTDPEFASKLTPEVKALHGFARLQQVNQERQARGEQPIQASVDHAIAEQIYDSDTPAPIALFLSQHPEELRTLRACKTPEALVKTFGRLEDRVRGTQPAAAAAAAETTKPPTAAELRARAEQAVDRSVSSATPPAPLLGKAGSGVDPLKKAIDTGDIGRFLELDRQERAEKRGLVARR